MSYLLFSESGARNKYVETSVVNTLGVISSLKGEKEFREAVQGRELHITIYGDNDFYSQREEVGSLF